MQHVPIVDAHLPIWDPQHFRMAWLDANTALDRQYQASDYRLQTHDIPIESMVYLQVEVEPLMSLPSAFRSTPKTMGAQCKALLSSWRTPTRVGVPTTVMTTSGANFIEIIWPTKGEFGRRREESE